MLTVKTEMRLEDFRAWSGGADTLEKLIDLGFCDELEGYIEELYPHGIDDTTLNDLLWFDSEMIWGWLNIQTDENGDPIIRDDTEDDED